MTNKLDAPLTEVFCIGGRTLTSREREQLAYAVLFDDWTAIER